MESHSLSVIEHLHAARQAVADADVDLFPYSPLQQVGFFILFFFPILALIVITLRIYSRLNTGTFGWDDALICVAMVLSIAETAASYMAMRTAYLGVHVYDIPKSANLETGLMWNYIIQLLYNPILSIVKSSVLLFMLRVGGHQASLRYTIHGLNTLNVCLMIATFITVVFQCSPISYFWKRVNGPAVQGSCINTGMFYVATSSLSLLTDLLVLGLPLWVFLGLQMPWRLKLALMGIFLIGLIVTVVSTLRLIWIIDTSFSIPTGDYTYDIRFTYSAAETNLAIISASGPALRPLLISWFPSLFGSSPTTPSGKRSYATGSTRHGSNATNKYNNNGYGTSSFAMKNIDGGRSKSKQGRTELREHSPSSSEEEIMTYNGIVKTTEVEVQYKSASRNSRWDGHNKQTGFDY